jgi:hypothetical protein
MSGGVFVRLAHVDDGAGALLHGANEILVLDRRQLAAAARESRQET